MSPTDVSSRTLMTAFGIGFPAHICEVNRISEVDFHELMRLLDVY